MPNICCVSGCDTRARHPVLGMHRPPSQQPEHLDEWRDALRGRIRPKINLYAEGGATDYIREVPSLLAKDARCKDFKKAE